MFNFSAASPVNAGDPLTFLAIGACSGIQGNNVASLYAVAKQWTVQSVRFDGLHRGGQVLARNVIDVDSHQHEVLPGFGEVPYDVLGIGSEAWFNPVLQGQKPLQDLAAALTRFGLHRRRLGEQNIPKSIWCV